MSSSPTPAGPSGRRSRCASTSSNALSWTRSATTWDELREHLDAWSEAIIEAGSYPKRIAGVYKVGGGQHFGSGLTIDTAEELFTEQS